MPVFSPIYSIPYLFVFFLLFLMWRMEISRMNRYQSINMIRNTAFVLLLFFIGLRGFIYSDWISYYSSFETLPTADLIDWSYFLPTAERGDSDWEPGFLLYAVLLKSLGVDYWGWSFISVLIDLFILSFLFKKKVKFYVLAFVIFYVYGGFGIEVNLMRNSKSIILFLLSIRYVKTRQFLPYLFLNLLGCSFHSSSLVYILLYFFLSRRIPKKIFWWVFLVGNIIFLFQIQFITPILIHVTDLLGGRIALQLLTYVAGGISYGITIGYLERCFMFMLFIRYYDKLIEGSDMYIYLNMFLAYFFFFFYFAEFSIIGKRLSVLFIPSYWFLLPTVYSFLITRKTKVYFCLFLFLYGSLKIISANNNILSKYDNLLFGIENYETRRYMFNRYSEKLFVN